MAGIPVGHLDLPGDRRFEVVIADLLGEPVDAIVNAANGYLSHGGGVAAAIADAAGRRLDDEGDAIVRQRGPIAVGDAVVTTAGDLPFKGVIHAVGPRQGQGDEEAKLVRAIQSALRCACARGWSSVSFPAVSSGIFAVPVDVCARAYVEAVRGFFDGEPTASLRLVRLALYHGPIVDAVKKVLAQPASR